MHFNTYRTAPTGPAHGMSLKLRAAEAAFIAKTSGKFIESTASILQTNCVSYRKSAANNGRIDRSINLAERISFSDGPKSNGFLLV